MSSQLVNELRGRRHGRSLGPPKSPAGGRWLLAVAPVVVLALLTACGAPPETSSQATQTAAAVVKQVSGTQAAVATVAGKVSGLEQTAVAPTTALGATMAVATVQAGATRGVATVQAVGTQVAGTPVISQALSPALAALATQAAGSGGPAMLTAVANSPMQIVDAKLEPTNTRVTIKNNGGTLTNVGGWVMLFTAFGVTVPANTLVLPGGSVNVHFAPGVNTPTDVYLGTGPEIMAESLKPGNRIVLVTPQGQPASVYQIR